MFSEKDLQIIAAALDTEADFLRAAERHGIPTVRQLATISALKAQVIDALEAQAKKAAHDAPKEAL